MCLCVGVTLRSLSMEVQIFQFELEIKFTMQNKSRQIFLEIRMRSIILRKFSMFNLYIIIRVECFALICRVLEPLWSTLWILHGYESFCTNSKMELRFCPVVKCIKNLCTII